MIKVAIVEDNFQFRTALVKLMESSDLFELKGVYSSAEDARANLLANQPDIAIIDIQLPTMSGISLIKEIQNAMPATQFLICTLHQDNEYIFEALKAGASGYILKDSTPEEIKNAVRDLFMGGAPMSPYIARKIINVFQKNKPGIDNYRLSERELEVLKLMSKGLLYKEIGVNLNISSNTVKNHLKSIYKKMHVQNKIEAINKYQAS